MRRRSTCVSCWALSIVILATACVCAADESPATVRVSGTATLSAPPDQAVIDIGIVSESEDADRAAQENAKKVDAVIAALRKVLGSDADSKLRTVSYSLQPRYAPYRQGVPQRIDGYTATNVVQVKSDDLKGVGRLIDVAIESGANRVQQLRFILKDDQPLRAQALREATLRARQRAESIASALDQRVARVISVEEGLRSSIPMRNHQPQLMQAKFAEADTAVLAGNIEVRESVTYTIELSD